MDSDSKHAYDYTMHMHLGIDVREACDVHRTGKGQWTYGFVSELLRRPYFLTLFTDKELPMEWKKIVENSAGKITVEHIKKRGLKWHWEAIKSMKENKHIDAYVSTTSYIIPFLLGTSKKYIPVVHDLIAFMREPHDKKAQFIERLTLGRAVRNASCIFSISESTKKDLLARYPQLSSAHVVPVYAGPINTGVESLKNAHAILCVATLCPRKNQWRLIKAYAGLPDELKKQHPLILVGKRGWDDEGIIQLVSATPGVEWKRYVPDEELDVLFSGTMIFAYPSLYEGFGLPVLDAMKRGIPVLTSDRGSLKEVAGVSALFVDPENIHAITGGLLNLLQDERLRKELIKGGHAQAGQFSWKRTVDICCEKLDKLDK